MYLMSMHFVAQIVPLCRHHDVQRKDKKSELDRVKESGRRGGRGRVSQNTNIFKLSNLHTPN